MLDILLTIKNMPNAQACLWGIVCANETFISIYGVIFTVIITIGVYIFGLQDQDQKIALMKITKIKELITDSLKFFVISFIAFPNPLYEFVNFILVGGLIFKVYGSFRGIFKFNENKFSGQKIVKEFKEGVINEKLVEFNILKTKNDAFEKSLEERRGSKEVERFLFDENPESYYFIRSQISGYITDINLDILFASEEKNVGTSVKKSYFIPYNISNGSSVNVDDVILGVKKEENQTIDEDRLRSYVSIKNEETLLSYLEAEVRPYYTEMFNLIKLGDSKSLELKLKEFSSFINRFVTQSESYVGIIQSINDEIILPLQRQTFKQNDIDLIRKISGFALGYLYESLDKRSIQTFNIFLRNLGNAFYESLSLEEDKRLEFHDVYFRWLKEVASYSLKPKILKSEEYLEFQISLLSSINGLLKLTFDRQDKSSFLKTLAFLDVSFSRENHEYQEHSALAAMVENKKSVVFGVTAWIYKYYGNRKNELFYKDVLLELFNALKKDPQYLYRDSHRDELNYYLSIYMKAVGFSEKRSTFGWDSWGMPTGSVYTITIRDDMKNLLIDRVLSVLIEKPEIEVVIDDKNYDAILAGLKEGDPHLDPFIKKGKLDFISTANLTDEQFSELKVRFYEVFKKITEQYEADVKKQLIEQPLDEIKFNEFAKENFDAYKKARVLNRIQSFIKTDKIKNDSFGYNMLLNKEQFVAITNIHYVHSDQFGEELARSEDNKILESIYHAFKSIPVIKKEKIKEKVSKENNTKAVILWANGHFDLENANSGSFIPYWQETNSKQDNGQYYQGSINGVPVYIIYKFQEQKKYPDTVFILQEAAFQVREFEFNKTENTQDTLCAHDPESCLTLSVTNLSLLEQEQNDIVEKWIEDDPSTNREQSLEKMRVSVIFKFLKALSTEDIKINKSKIKIFHVS